jgi:DEAD/DEAH box helicase domain-containing protein
VPKQVDYYTRTRGNKATEILEVKEQGVVFGARVGFGRLKVTETITGYERRKTRGGQILNIVPLDLPPLTFETEGLWYEFPTEVQEDAERRLFHFMGGIHAMEHASIGILPLLVMTDRNDLGGISTPLHPQLGRAAVFIYDGVPGGVGLTRQAFGRAGELLERTLSTITGCSCENGCPSCVHSPKCGSGNRPIDKVAAQFVAESIIRGVPETTEPFAVETVGALETAGQDERGGSGGLGGKGGAGVSSGYGSQAPAPSPPGRFAVFDLETQLSAQDVGGWHNASKMRLSVGVVYDSALDDYLVFTEDRVGELIQSLEKADLVIGFNCKRFDYEVLRGYSDFDFGSLPTLDMLEHIKDRIGVRISLDTLGTATLGASKTADGLKALEWWKQGKLDEITRYCKADVAITRDIYLFGRDNGYLLYRNKALKIVRCPVTWF